MNNQTFIIASIILCSLGGWYVVITKYLALKKMVKDYDNEMPQHIPGMGPPPVSNIPFTIPDDLQQQEHYAPPPRQQATPRATPAATTAPPAASALPTAHDQRREICNYACILHLCGFAIISGIPFLNIVLPTMFWLWKKEQHSFIDKQGREVINFQITFSLIQFLCLGGGVLFIRYMPTHAEKLFAFTKITRIVFSTGMYIPFNVFTAIPFFWCCIVMIRGAVAAYHGVSYKYPAAQQFVFNAATPAASHAAIPPPPPVQQKPKAQPVPNVSGKVSFS